MLLANLLSILLVAAPAAVSAASACVTSTKTTTSCTIIPYSHTRLARRGGTRYGPGYTSTTTICATSTATATSCTQIPTSSSSTTQTSTPVRTASGGTSSPTSVPPVTGDLKTDMLSYHNYYRSMHSAPALSWSDTVAASANNASYTCLFQHNKDSGYGENLAQGYDPAASAVTAWYNEYPNYNGDFSSASGHYTQVVWISTTQIGCVYQNCAGGKLLRCEYNPPGNVGGQFAANVKPS